MKAAKAFDDRNDVRPLIAILRGKTATSLLVSRCLPISYSATAWPNPAIQGLIVWPGRPTILQITPCLEAGVFVPQLGARASARRRKGEAL